MTPTLAITRPLPAAAAFRDAVFAQLGEEVPTVISPAFEIVPISADLPKGEFQVIFTSANGVAQAKRLGLTSGVAWCVGDRTAALAKTAGFEAVSAGGTANDLVSLVLSRRPDGLLVHLAGQHTRGNIAEKLSAAGLPCKRIVCYQQDALPPTASLCRAAGGTNPVIAPVFSPRSALPLAGLEWQGALHGIAMSTAVAEALTDMGCDVVITAKAPTEEAMIAATCAQLRAVLDR